MDKPLLDTATKHLSRIDKVMAKIIKQCSPITPSTTKPPHYHALVSAIINQQLSVKAGRTIEKRLLTKHGGRFFNAEKILTLKTTTIRECGLSKNKIHYIRTLAQAITEGELNFRKFSQKSDDDIRNELIKYPGIGSWSVDIFLISSLRRADVFPIGDLVIRKTMQQHYQLTDDTQYDKYITIAEAWRPYRTVASFYLWKASH